MTVYRVSVCVRCGAQCDPDLHWGCEHGKAGGALRVIEVVPLEPTAVKALERIADGTYQRGGRSRRFTSRDLRDIAREALEALEAGGSS